ncbi:Ger(x)C family spore germination protein [Clostridium sp. D2Q-11]|uniref:Ger(X)C family spore germination protein n=1 Tax=Anaeromonas frigoriresistens TaxID=2683708 RepID=A0A942Z7J3_9FIRM|nr:Ger(x)C family spore germination protein [Anaeromonas frigoriresistens]MBS4537020.1 Ger(x)C family spore germination protein [Anaeromonas frigoriresistens]
MKKSILGLMFFFVLLMNTACWDKKEIENRAYISAIGIDCIEGKENSPGFVLTYEYPNLAAYGKTGEGEPRFTIAVEGATISEISRQVATRIENDMFFRHLKVVIIGEDVAKDQIKLATVLNALDRSPDIGRRIIILIAEGKARDVINTEMKEKPVIGRFIWDLVQRENVGGRYYTESIGELFTHLHRSKVAMIGIVMPREEELKLAGASIIKDIKMIGKLDETDTTSVLILREKINNEDVTIIRDSGRYVITYIIENFNIEKSMKIKDGSIKFTYDIENEGYIEEYLEPGTIALDTDILDTKKIKEIEKELNNEIETKILNTINKLQDEFATDIIGIEDYISKREPDLWKELEDNWEEEFRKIDFQVNVNSKIRRVGLTE